MKNLERRKRGAWHSVIDIGIGQQECVCLHGSAEEQSRAEQPGRKRWTVKRTQKVPARFTKQTDTRHAILRVGTHGKGQAEAGAFSMSCTTKQGIHQTNSHTQTDVRPVHAPARWTTQH